MRMDLHMHSTASDGVKTPVEVVDLAYKNGVEVMALTDHDTVAGLSSARTRAKELGIRFIDGVELSVTWSDKTIHVVSLAPKNLQPYEELTKVLCKKRDLRARAMAAKFDAMGIYNTYEQALELAGNPLNLSRRHFAMALLQRGTVGSEDAAFDRYLKDDGCAFVKTEWMSLNDAMTLVHQTGGVAVLAHPGRYSFSNGKTTYDLLTEFKALGGDAIEVTTGSHFVEENERYTRVAVNMGFWASTGSDYHGFKPGRPEPGLQDELPSYLPTVLELIK